MPESATQADLITPDNAWRPAWIDSLVLAGIPSVFVLMSLGLGIGALIVFGTIAMLIELPDQAALLIPLALSYVLAFGAYSPNKHRTGWALASGAFLLTFLVITIVVAPIGMFTVLAVPISHGLLFGGIRLAVGIAKLTSTRYWYAINMERGQCPRCRYNIRDLPEPRCPECGGTWTPLDE